ncbi:lipopolysaccharide biosynthesis protein WzxC [Abditibacteriota bacterium]|nr:lipopolysaccharide biosynthesis protein WzxC [Abditibacteriota bacterium]
MSRRFRRTPPRPEFRVVPLPLQDSPAISSTTGSGLGTRATSGFIWLLAQSVLTKAAGLVAQLLWTRFLLPSDLGLFTVAYAITLGVGWMQEAGTREVLVRRPKHYERRANSAFWLSVLIALGGYAFVWSLAPLLEHFYNRPQLALLVRIASLSPTLVSLTNVATAKLEIEMRFSLLARVNLAVFVSQSILTVVFAALKFGPLSFVLPLAITQVVRCAYLYSVARPPIHLKLESAKWKYLLSGIGLLIITGACNFVLWQGDNIILGRVVSPAEVGLYAFAYNLSQQMLFLLSNNINSVLLPTLSRLNLDRTRQLDVYMRAIRALAVVGILLCLLPGVLAPALLGLFFKAKWGAAAPILFVLSIGMAVRVADVTSEALLKAQGRFSVLTASSIAHAATFAIAGLLAAHYKGALGMACAVGACIALFGPLRVYVSIRPLGGHLRDVLGVFGGAFALFATSQAIPFFIAHWVFPNSHLALLVLSSVLGTLIYLALLRTLSPALWNDVLSRLKRKRSL